MTRSPYRPKNQGAIRGDAQDDERPRRAANGHDPDVRRDEEHRQPDHRQDVGHERCGHDALAVSDRLRPGLDEHRVDDREAGRGEGEAADLGLLPRPAGHPDGGRDRDQERARRTTRRRSRRWPATPAGTAARPPRAPARNVRTMPANVPMNESQSGIAIVNTFPTATPPASSISATERPISIEIVLAIRIVTARTAQVRGRSPLHLRGRVSGVEAISPEGGWTRASSRWRHPSRRIAGRSAGPA